eukprot:scaffold119626_cov17-Tisochrysis_lutea.AAC.1
MSAVFDGSHPIHGADEQSARVIDYTHTSCPYTVENVFMLFKGDFQLKRQRQRHMECGGSAVEG